LKAKTRAGSPVRFPAILLVTVVWLAGCGSFTPDEELIRGHIQDMVEALEDQNARRFMGPVAEDFTAATLNLDQRGARLLLRREMMARERIRARTSSPEIRIRGEDRATATFRILLAGGTGLIPDEGRWYRVETGWRRDGSDWEMISAEWEAVVGE